MSKKRNFRNDVKLSEAKKEAKINERKAVQQAAKKKQMQHVFMGLGIAIAVIAVISLGLIMFYGDSVVARINGQPIRASELQAHVSTAESQLRARGQDIMTQDWQRDLREETVRVIAMPRVFEDFGREIGLEFPEGTLDATIIHNVTQAIIDDPIIFAEFEGYMEPGQTVAEVEAEYAEAELASQVFFDFAQEIYERLLDGEDFDELMETYGDDPGMRDNPEGYNFAGHQMVQEFTDGTLALEIGEFGPPVRSEFGWHIIMRIEPDPDNIMGGIEVPEDELLAAKHILIEDRNIPLDRRLASHDQDVRNRMIAAVVAGFATRINDADLVFRSALNRVELQGTSSPDIHVGF